MDPLQMANDMMMPGDPSYLGGDDDEDSGEEQKAPEEGSVEWFKARLDEVNLRREEDQRQAMQKITQQSQQLADSTKLMQNLLMSREYNQAVAPAGQTPQPQQDVPLTWEDYARRAEGGQPVSASNKEMPLTPAQAQEIARQEISRTLQGIRQHESTGNHLVQRFMQENADLMPHSEMVAEYYGMAQAKGATQEQAYEYATQRVRQLAQQGRLVPVNGNGKNGRSAGSPPSGGQGWGQQAQRPATPAGLSQQTRKDQYQDLMEWTKKRREEWHAKAEAQ